MILNDKENVKIQCKISVSILGVKNVAHLILVRFLLCGDKFELSLINHPSLDGQNKGKYFDLRALPLYFS